MNKVNLENPDCKQIVCISKGNLYLSEISDNVAPIFISNNLLDISYLENLLSYDKISETVYLICKNDIYAPSLNLLKKFYDNLNFEQNSSCFLGVIFVFQNKNLIAFLNFNVTYEDCEIEYICVSKDFKKKGVASLMLFYLDDFCKKIVNNNVNKILLEVGENNLPAIHLYKKFNFNKVSERKKYYKNSENALILEKKI